MRIVIDMQGLQTESRFRGIGRYALSFAQAVIRHSGDHEVILAISGLFPHTVVPIRAAFDGLLSQKNILVWHAPGPVSEVDLTNTSRQHVAELIREAFLVSLQPDIVHIMSLFEGYGDDAVTHIGTLDQHTRVTMALYDLIPLLNPNQYLTPNPSYAKYYNRKIESLHKVSAYFAISAFSRQEGLQQLQVDADKIINVSTAIEADFKPLSISEDQTQHLGQKFGLTRPFVLYTGGADERKNLPRLIQAYAALPNELRRSHQLLFVGKLSEGSLMEFKHVAKTHGLRSDELIFTGYVTDEELIQLYNLCKLFVFPSWHEGFGLPALEAMACGAAVIGANTSSLPEVIGMDKALFDPLDVNAITAKLTEALENEAFLTKLRAHGLKQAALFSWDGVAQRAIEAWEQIYTEPVISAKEPEASWSQVLLRLSKIHHQLIQDIASILATDPAPTDMELRQVAMCLDRNERQAQTLLRAKPLPKEIVWRLEGPFDSSYSLALLNRETARALSQLGHKVVLHSTEGPGDFEPDQHFLEQNPDLAKMHSRVASTSQIEADVVSRNLYPPRVNDMEGRLNLLHNYNWEESGFPLEWVTSFNQSLQGILVATQHVKKVFIDNGVKVPLAVSGVGTDHWENVTADISTPLQARRFRFLHVSSCFPRKGVDSMLEAYGQTFSAQDEVTLVIKTFDNPHNELTSWLEAARAKKPDYPDVLVLESDYSDAQIKGLYEQCHALVAPSRAEGFGLPMAEAMLSGLAVITTGWSGQIDFCTADTAWLVDYDFERAHTHFNLFSSVWAEPKVSDLARIMREVYETPEQERLTRIKAGRQLLLEKLRWTQVAERMVESAQRWSLGPDLVSPRIGWISTWNTPCGIATYSEKLISSIPSQVTVLAAQADHLTADDQSTIHRCWTQGNDDSLGDLELAVAQSGVDTLVVQFNYGFFDLETLATFLLKRIDDGIKIVVMMHATTDPIHETRKKLSLLVPALARCARILVHSPHDMNRLKAYGLVDNVALFPHGILDFVPPAKPPVKKDTKFVVASYGFFLPHKGLVELIEAVGSLHNQGELIELQMINAEYPNPISTQIIEQAKNKIKKAQLQEVVKVCTDYLEDEECLRRLAAADLVVFPYQDTGESSSAAVRYGIASGSPVAVTPLAIFEDVDAAVFHLPGQSADDIAKGIKDIRQKIMHNDALASRIKDSGEQWRAQHRYSVVGQRLFNMLYALRNEGL